MNKTGTDKLHHCSGTLPYGLCGEALSECYEEKDGKLWAGNGEYASRVNYCPYCGYKAKKQVKY